MAGGADGSHVQNIYVPAVVACRRPVAGRGVLWQSDPQ